MTVLVVLGALAGPRTLASTPLEVYGKLPSLEDLALSPGGGRMAYIRTVGDQRVLAVNDLHDGRVLFGERVGTTKVRSLQWATDDDLLVMVVATQLPPLHFVGDQPEWYELLHCNVPARKTEQVSFHALGERASSVVSSVPTVRIIDGRTTLFVNGLRLTERIQRAFFSYDLERVLFRYDLASASTRIVASSRQPHTQWLIDAAGEIAAQFQYDESSKMWALEVRRGGALQPVARGESPLDVPELLGFDSSGDALVVRFIENGRSIWKPWNLKTGVWDESLGEGKSFERVFRDGHSGRLVGGSHGDDDDQYEFFDAEVQAHWDGVRRAFPADERVELVSAGGGKWSRVVVRVFGSKDGYGYHLFDWNTQRIIPIGAVYEGLSRVAEVKAITYSASDGFKIPAYLTLPAGQGQDAHRLPLIVMPHGGPALADSKRFDWWAQALADRGYAVLQANYRGSDLGRVHLAAGFGEWGRKMQTDLSDGVHYLAELGLIDPERVCIVGASYGGYAALAGMTLQPGVYRCGVSVAGISDIRAMMRWADNNAGRRDNYAQRYWDRYMGLTGPDDPRLAEISPVEHAPAVRGPVLLVHGRDDTVVPYEQSELMEKALHRAGKSVDLVTLKHEDHWLSSSETRLQMLEAVVAFLERYNPA